MHFHTCSLPGVLLIDLDLKHDERGYLARTFCLDELGSQGSEFQVVQCNVTYSARKGTLRGLHYQSDPATEQKIVHCTQGAVLYVLVDLRPGSSTYLQHAKFDLDAVGGRRLYVPGGFASGAQAQSDYAQLSYMMSERYAPGRESGIRYDDPALQISWPLPVTALSEKDAAWLPFDASLLKLER
jgi:dTDP-4-dehydrorhamnose 3,5-epimerase